MSKRIALVGNMNNNFYALTRYLREAGYDAHLFFRLAMDHFQPKADTFGEEYKEYCHQVDWLDKGFHNADKKKIKEELSGFDFFIGQGEEAALAYACGYNIDVYYPYGSDVYKYSHLPQEYTWKAKLKSLVVNDATRPTYAQMKEGTMAKYLRGAIVNARYILAESTNDEFEAKLKELAYKGAYEKVAMPFVYTGEFAMLENGFIPPNPVLQPMQKIREEHDFILMYHGRQEWKTFHNPFTIKNTHHLFIAFASYLKKNHASKSCLVMLEYGSDVDHSKALINELGIADKVFWFPKMYRKELMYIVKNADVCCGEFNYSYLTFGTVVEAMFMKKPVITYRQDSLYTDVYPKLYPCFNAREPEEIEEAIATAIANPQLVKQMGEEAYAWVTENFIQKPLQRLIQIIETGK
ncbi:MAG: glycosyltransferase [Flavipsychrobacter sp.]